MNNEQKFNKGDLVSGWGWTRSSWRGNEGGKPAPKKRYGIFIKYSQDNSWTGEELGEIMWLNGDREVEPLLDDITLEAKAK